MNTLSTLIRKYLSGGLALPVVAVSAFFILSPMLPQVTAEAAGTRAAGVQQGGGQQGGDEIKDQLRLRDGSCTDAVVVKIFEGDQDQDQDQDQLRLHDGSCDGDCDGEPDQDRIRDRLGQN